MKSGRVVTLFIASSFLLNSIHTFAAEVENSQEQSTVIENSMDKAGMPGNAKDWHLTESEWAKYQKLMQSAAGLWYRGLSPPAVLGMYADSPEDEKHFAEVYAQQEHKKVEQELAFNKAAFNAMRQLYSNEPMIKPFDITPFSPLLGQ